MIRDVSYTIQVLENIGLPLLCANIRAHTPRDSEVLRLREMLDRSVQLTRRFDKSPLKQSSTPGKMKLAAIASKTIAATYEADGTIPEEGDLPHLLNKIEFILDHMENTDIRDALSSDQEQNPDEENPPSSPLLAVIPRIEAFIPILQAAAEFSYGLNESKLIQMISDRLHTETNSLSLKLFGNLPDDLEDSAHTAVLRILAALYAETHRAETRNIMQMSEKARLENGSQLTIDIVWRAFEKKIAMLEALTQGLIPAEHTQAAPTQHPEPSPEPAPEAPPPVIDTLPGMTLNATGASPIAEAMPPLPPESASSPLAFYKKTQKK